MQFGFLLNLTWFWWVNMILMGLNMTTDVRIITTNVRTNTNKNAQPIFSNVLFYFQFRDFLRLAVCCLPFDVCCLLFSVWFCFFYVLFAVCFFYFFPLPMLSLGHSALILRDESFFKNGRKFRSRFLTPSGFPDFPDVLQHPSDDHSPDGHVMQISGKLKI